MNEIFEIVDVENNIIGSATRTQCHGNPDLIHRTSHVVVFDQTGRILLQKRSINKDIQPGKWDTAVGGHLMPGESFEVAAIREMGEELGIPNTKQISFLFEMKIRNLIESENTAVFYTVYAGPFDIQKEEVQEIKFWSLDDLTVEIAKGNVTPYCEQEIIKLIKIGKLF